MSSFVYLASTLSWNTCTHPPQFTGIAKRSKQWCVLLPRTTNNCFFPLWVYGNLHRQDGALVCACLCHSSSAEGLFWVPAEHYSPASSTVNVITFPENIHISKQFTFNKAWVSFSPHFILTPKEQLNAISSKCGGNCFLSIWPWVHGPGECKAYIATISPA